MLCTPIHPALPSLSQVSLQNENTTIFPALQQIRAHFNITNDYCCCLSWECSLFKLPWETACHEIVICHFKLFKQTNNAFTLVAYSYRPVNSIIWEKTEHNSSRRQAVLCTCVKVTAVFVSLNINLFHHKPVSNNMLSRGQILSFCFPPPGVLNWKTQWWTH